MSDKPKIYGTCPAGCLWETVHMSDFEKSAAFIQQYPNESGEYVLKLGKDYKIFAPKNTDNSFTSSVVLSYLKNGVVTTYTFPKNNIDAYAEAFTFRLLDVSVNTMAINIVFEYAGSRYTETISGSNISLLEKDFLKVSGATNVYLYNSDTQLIGVRGKDGAGCYVNDEPTPVYFDSDPQTQIDTLGQTDQSLQSQITALKNLYGVGAIYMSTVNVSPASFIGGSWLPIEDTFLLAAGSTYAAGTSGGEATHTLTIAEMPSHTHTQSGGSSGVNDDGNLIQRGYSATLKPVANASNTGGGQAHNNMPPYLAVYMWKRTA
ncbi:MAG: phage tail protein [Candidatus Coproplasma sp.]